MKAYYGRISLAAIEAVAGGFLRVILKPVSPRPRYLDGLRPLTAVGKAWSCGCEARGASQRAHWPNHYIAPCASHVADFAHLPVVDVPDEYTGGRVVERRFATIRPGMVLIADETVWHGY